MSGWIIKLENLAERFSGLVAVNGISFSVVPGEILSFLSPNGAGKTTTSNVPCTLARHQDRLSVNGFDVECASQWGWF